MEEPRRAGWVRACGEGVCKVVEKPVGAGFVSMSPFDPFITNAVKG